MLRAQLSGGTGKATGAKEFPEESNEGAERNADGQEKSIPRTMVSPLYCLCTFAKCTIKEPRPSEQMMGAARRPPNGLSNGMPFRFHPHLYSDLQLPIR